MSLLVYEFRCELMKTKLFKSPKLKDIASINEIVYEFICL